MTADVGAYSAGRMEFPRTRNRGFSPAAQSYWAIFQVARWHIKVHVLFQLPRIPDYVLGRSGDRR